MRVRIVTSLAVLSPIGAITKTKKKKKLFLADVILLNMSLQWLKSVYM